MTSYGYEKIFNKIIEIFNYDKEKALLWWITPNDHLGNKAPFEMVKEGKGKDLMRIIRRCF